MNEKRDTLGRFIKGDKRPWASGSNSPHWKGGNLLLHCLHCKKEFYRKPSRIKYGYGRYCSRGCSAKLEGYQVGHQQVFPKGYTAWNKNRGMSREERRKSRIVHTHNRRKKTKDLTVEITQRVYEDNIKKHGTLTCILCLRPIEFGQDSLEHKTPLSRGGTNLYENLGVAHKRCNSKKGKKTLEEWKNHLIDNGLAEINRPLQL